LPYEYDYLTGTDDGYDTVPHLSEMVAKALDLLDDDPDGLFLMIEAGRIDHACHGNHLQRSIHETIELHRTVETVMAWARLRNDTLVLVTADHETGGLTVLENRGQGTWPLVTWSTTGHTGANVPAYAWGVTADLVAGTMDNTDFVAVATADPVYVAAELDHEWVYQNAPQTTGNRHKCTLTLTTGGLDSATVDVTQDGDSPGSVVVEATADPMVWTIRGSQVEDNRAGDVVLTIVAVDDAIGRTASRQVALAVRPLADITGDGYVDAEDKLEINKALNGLSTTSPDRALDLTADGVIDAIDKLAINRLLNGIDVP
jgi:hypothetical protein